jgi:galactosylxylosylprotein 3-beta-galactosyltransferase
MLYSLRLSASSLPRLRVIAAPLSFVIGFLVGTILIPPHQQDWPSPPLAVSTAAPSTLPPVVLPALEPTQIPEHQWTNQSLYGCPARPLKLLFLIMSPPYGIPRRAAIRRSWLSLYLKVQGVHYTGKFVIGTKGLAKNKIFELTYEKNQFKDVILFDDFEDTFANLTNKVIKSIVWAQQNMDFDYLIKNDDDSFVQIDRFLNALKKMDCPKHLYWGYFTGCGYPDSSGKWAEYNWYLCPHFLPYAMGGGYVLSKELVGLIANLSDDLQAYSNEDVSMGLWMSPFNVTRFHDLRFNTEGHTHGCDNNYIISHKEKASSFIQKKRRILFNGLMCVAKRELTAAYIYNWTVSPPLCCQRQFGLTIPE